MNEYALVKALHIVSSTILFGTGIGSAFYFLVAGFRGQAREMAFVAKWVVRADWIFTTPAVILQPLTGFYLAHLAGFPLNSTWIVAGTVLYLVAGACWLPVLWIQLRMRDLAAQAADSGAALPPRFYSLFRGWIGLGVPAFLALIVVFYLMVAKPP